MELTLRWPKVDEEEEFLRAHHAATPGQANFLHYYEEGMPYQRYLQVLKDQHEGVNLPGPTFVPSTFLFAFVGDRIVGRTSIRHRLNEHLLQQGGHIGYAVIPEFRRRGYATEILHQALNLARDLSGDDRFLLTCDDNNVGSIKVIEHNGGVLENVVAQPDGGVPLRRYWIER